MARAPECLVLALALSPALPAAEAAESAECAFRTVRTRVVYGDTRADMVGVVVGGVYPFSNPLADEDPGLFANVDLACRALKISLDPLAELRALRLRYQAEVDGVKDLEFPRKKANVLDVLCVAGHEVATRSTLKTSSRIILFTDARGKIHPESDYEKAIAEVCAYATNCAGKDIQVDIVFADGLSAEDVAAEEQEDAEAEDSSDILDYDEMFAGPDKNAATGKAEAEASDDNESEGARLARVESATAIYFERDILDAVHENMATRYRRVTERREISWKAQLELEDEHTDCAAHTAASLRVPSDGAMRKMGLLCAASRATGGNVYNIADAYLAADNPRPKARLAKAKFAGVLDFAGVFKIPVKVYSRVSELKRPSASKVAWSTTNVQQRLASVSTSNTQYYVESELLKKEDDGPKSEVPTELVTFAYPYGPNLITPDEDETGHTWDIACDKALRVICVVLQNKVPMHLFMSAVSVVLPMSGPKGCEPQVALRAVVTALAEESSGLVVRYVVKDGAKPKLFYMWPKVEVAGEGDTACDAWYFYMVELPTSNDIKPFQFGSLEEDLSDVSIDADAVMRAFIETRDLDKDVVVNNINKEYDEVEEDVFDSTKCCNPALDRFFSAVINRALAGSDITELPDLAAWAKNFLDPKWHIRSNNREAAAQTLSDVKRLFVLTKREESNRSFQRTHIRPSTGDEDHIAHLMPPPVTEEEAGLSCDADANADYGENYEFGTIEAQRPSLSSRSGADHGGDDEFEEGIATDDDDAASLVTDCPIMISHKTPVADMWSLIKTRRTREAFDLMSSVILGLVYENELALAQECIIAFRTACDTKKWVNPYHSILLRIHAKTENNRHGKATAASNIFRAFLRFVGASNAGMEGTFARLMPANAVIASRMFPPATEVDVVLAGLEQIASSPADKDGTEDVSAVTTT
jgi:Ku70/Ku80 beta-barrel domain